MAKKPIKLTFQDIVLNADAETIKQAFEARQQIDVLLAEREEAYRRIAELEVQVEAVVGEEGVFPFPAPPMPVAGFTKSMPATRVKVKKAEEPVEEIIEAAKAETESDSDVTLSETRELEDKIVETVEDDAAEIIEEEAEPKA
ncbi:hypothetical protein ACFLQY_03685 [Verrucomicrobiota bacterium]